MKAISNKVGITNNIIIDAPLSLVWHAWTISERVAQWFAPETIIEAKEGGAFELYFVPGNRTGMNTRGCKIIKMIDQDELQFNWKGPDQFEEVMNKGEELTSVKVKLVSINEGTTKVIIEHTGFKNEDRWAEAIKWHQMAWSGVLSSLKSALEKGEGELCCHPNQNN
ncbi:SRPBCC family protein [Cytobacillus praedii]|uniref:SRPBCC family protein n=1 Tax=Cytobacillus praedii TaxID=1742358 RepID=UPI002E1EDD65|nr:SRPBCC domain-containing protein [Cytobacillus praedii]